MPRTKSNKTKWEKIDKAIIEEKNCLQAELFLQEPLTLLQAHTLQSYCKFNVQENRQLISFATRNSWKGLIMACLSIAYCKYGLSFLNHAVRTQQYLNTKVEFDYMQLLHLLKDSDTSKEAKPIIERIAMPPSWKPCYVMGTYTLKEVCSSIKRITKLLGLNASKSLIVTGPLITSHIYKNYPVTSPQQTDPWRVSDFIKCTEGIAPIKGDVMESLYGDCRAMKAPYQLKPQELVAWSEQYDDPGKPIPLFGYEISKQSVEYICTYFPFLETDFVKESSQLDGGSWIVFDRKHLGKWG